MIALEPDYKSAISLIYKLLKYDRLSNYHRQELFKLLSGLKAEKEITYSLSAYFKHKKDVIVINNLKINHNGVTAQVDHLIISRKAMYFIESKSVSDSIEINEFDEWFRIWCDKTIPIDSPILQVKQQEEIILQFMKHHLPEFREKLLGIQGKIGYYPNYVFVAISEKGKITGEGRKKHKDTLMKHDKIPIEIKKLENGTLVQTIISGKYFLKQHEIEALAELFLKFNINPEPIEKIHEWADKHNIPKEYYAISNQKKCTKCNKNTIFIKWGKYGYYFVCHSCNNKFSIKESCPACGKPAKIKKDKESYNILCSICNFTELYFSNNSNN